MENNPTSFISVKVTTLCTLLITAVACGVAMIFADTHLNLSADRQLAAVGILSPGILILISIWAVASGAVTKVKPYTAYVVADPDQDYPLRQGKIIFDNHQDATYLCYPKPSGQEINYSIPDIPLEIQASKTTVKYQVGWEGKLRELFAIQCLAISHDEKLKQPQFSLELPTALWFERWVRYKNNELEDYITSLEARTQPFPKREIEQKVGLTHTRFYARFGLNLEFGS